MTIFCTDLDNTLIYSYKRTLPQPKRCVEYYEGREVSFMTERSVMLLKRISEKIPVIPVSTRSVAQYERVKPGIQPRYALVCNGGVLLVDGRRNEEWYQESLELIKDCGGELSKAKECLENDIHRSFEVRLLEKLFLFTKSWKPQRTIERLESILDSSKVDVFENGAKVYVVPKELSKGHAIERLRRYLETDKIIAAGDSKFDISMLAMADAGYAPAQLEQSVAALHGIRLAPEGRIFSEYFLEEILKQI